MELKDYGKEPLAFNIEEATLQNKDYRTTLWQSDHFQSTLIRNPDDGSEIGMEIQP